MDFKFAEKIEEETEYFQKLNVHVVKHGKGRCCVCNLSI